MAKELTYETECGDEDKLYRFTYEFEPYNRGGRDEPPSGGMATIYEIRDENGVKIEPDDWLKEGFSEKYIERLQEQIYAWHNDQERDRYEAAMEDKADAERERRQLGE